MLNPMEECLKSRKKIYNLPRAAEESRVNDFNPLLLLMWKANMDIQFISESSLALAHYVTGYVTKAEQGNMQDVWQQVNSNASLYSELWSFGVRSFRSRECGMYEASDLLLGDHLYEKSEQVKWVAVSLPHKRKRRLKDHNVLLKMQESDPNSTDILQASMLDTHYPQRPIQLEYVCLYDFIKWYEYSGTSQSGERMYTKVSSPRLPNHKLFDPNNENQREEYFYSLMLLFVPFRNESALIGEGENAEAAFNHHIHCNKDLFAHHDKLQAMMQAQSKVKEINEAREKEQEPCDLPVEDLFVKGEAKQV